MHTHPNDDDLWHLGRSEGTPDNNVYQVGTVGSGNLHGVPVGYSQFNPAVGQGAGSYSGGGLSMQSWFTIQRWSSSIRGTNATAT
jgi:hypothetical protein